ncbi:MAG: DUF1858 domain-containing protein [Nitrospirota bacterium]
MDKYPKMFIRWAIIYLLIGTIIGFLMGVNMINRSVFRFAHIHINLLGFMAMIVCGIAYHILPRFNARPLKWPGLVSYHFYLANIGIIGMVSSQTLALASGLLIFSILFHLASTLMVLSIIFFVANIYGLLTDPKPKAEPEKAANNQKTEEESPLKKLFSSSQVIGKPEGSISRGERCRKEVLVGDLIKVYPETKKVFETNYGENCFTCPGQQYESIEQTANMHNMPVEMILDDINKAIDEGLKAGAGR